jgi:predicted nucleotidyltransferase
VLQTRPKILFAILYGSAVEVANPRDLDIGLYVDRNSIPPARELDYAFALADELERKVPYPIDVRVINDAPLGFRFNVSQERAVLVNDSASYYQFLERTWNDLDDLDTFRQQISAWLTI